MVDYSDLDDIHKKRIAREAASKYSSAYCDAVREYVYLSRLINKIPQEFREIPPDKNDCNGISRPTWAYIYYDLPPATQKEFKEKSPKLAKAAEIYRSAEEEMLALLPKYRHPVHNPFAEQMIFFAVDQLDGTVTLLKPTPLMQEVQESMPEPMRSKMLSELEAHELTKARLDTVSKEKEKLQGLVDNARQQYQPLNKGEKVNARQKRVVRTLGFSDGKRHKTFAPEALYRDYVRLVRHKNFNRIDAIGEVARQYNIRVNTALDALTDVRKDVKKHIKRRFSAEEQEFMLPYLRGLIPNKREVEIAK